MKRKRIVAAALAAVLALSLAACAKKDDTSGISISGESVDVNDIALRPEGEAAQIFENDGKKLLVPLEYYDVVVTEMPENDEDGILFSVSEKASIEADKAQGGSGEGAGWLFSIGRVSEAQLQEMFSNDIPGAEAFAKDAEGNYYIYYHPTDVRIVRESYEGMGDETNEDWQQWTALNEWAQDKVRDTFVSENGLEAYEPESSADEPAYSPDELVGRWAEKIAGRGLITITKASDDAYDVLVEWSNGAAEQYIWEMTATPGGGNGGLRYENGRHLIRTYASDEEYTDDVQYEDGTGELYLNSAYEVMWQDDIDGAGDNTVFVNAG